MKFTFAVESISLVDRCMRVVYTPADTTLAPYHGTIASSLETLSLPIEEAKEALRKDIIVNAPITYWQSQIDLKEIEVPSDLLEVIGKDFLVSDEELQSVITEIVTEPSENAENFTPIQQALNTIANTRYEVESQGIVWADSESVSWFLDTSTESQNRFASARLAVEAGTRSDGGVWKCATLDEYGTPALVFRPTSNAQIIEWSDLCHAHVQKCFEAEALAVAKAIAGDTASGLFMQEFTSL